MKAILDANVVAGAVCWNGEAFGLFVKLARRRFTAYATVCILDEIRNTCLRLIEVKQPKHNAGNRLTWYCDAVRLVDPTPLGRQRSRDKKDDPYLAAALASKADYIVTHDKDLLALGKPFGVEILKPMLFLKRLED